MAPMKAAAMKAKAAAAKKAKVMTVMKKKTLSAIVPAGAATKGLTDAKAAALKAKAQAAALKEKEKEKARALKLKEAAKAKALAQKEKAKALVLKQKERIKAKLAAKKEAEKAFAAKQEEIAKRKAEAQEAREAKKAKIAARKAEEERYAEEQMAIYLKEQEGAEPATEEPAAEEPAAEKAEEEAIEEENKQLDMMSLNEDDVGDLAEEGTGKVGQSRQESYKLYPARSYVTSVAKKLAIQRWGPDDRHKLEVKIACLTEGIRKLVLHCREQPKDPNPRHMLIMKISNRRKLLDLLSWSNLESYIKIRDALKIRHYYRMEALIGRADRYKYQIRRYTPGRKSLARMRKAKRLLQARLARQLKRGDDENAILKTKQKLTKKQLFTVPYEQAQYMVAGKDVPEYKDPLDVP